MNSEIVPTVGRVVLCHRVSGFGPLPGVIMHVWGDTPDALINALAFGDGVNDTVLNAMFSVRVLDPDSPAPAEGQYCTWMPFQKGQAARTQAAETLTESKLRQIVREELGASIDWIRSQVVPAVGPTPDDV